MSMKTLSGYLGTVLTICVVFGASKAYAGFSWAPVQTPPEQVQVAPTTMAAPVPMSASLSSTTISSNTTAAAAPSVVNTSNTFTPVATDSPELVAPVIIGDTPPATTISTPPATTISTPPAAAMPNLQPTPPDDIAPSDIGHVSMAPMHPAPPPMPPSGTPPADPMADSFADAPLPPTAPPANLSTSSASDDQTIVKGFAKQVPLTVALRQVLPPSYSFSIDQDVDIGVMVSFKGGRPWPATLTDMLTPVGLAAHDQGQMVLVTRLEPAGQPMPPLSTKSAPARAPAPGYAHIDPGTPMGGSSITYGTPGVDSDPAMMNSSRVVPNTAATNLPPLSPTTAEMPTVPMAGTIATSSLPTPQISDKVSVSEVWTAERGDSLRKVLTDWSTRNHVEVEWLAEYDYPLQASVNFTGAYEDAVRNLLVGFEGAHPQPYAQLHANPGLGQMVLVVHARGNTNKD